MAGANPLPHLIMAKLESEIEYFKNKSKDRFINHLLKLFIILILIILLILLGVLSKNIGICYIIIFVVSVIVFFFQLGRVAYWYKDFSIISHLYEHATGLDIEIVESKEE